MVNRRTDETGNRYGRLRVVSLARVEDKTYKVFWHCVCDCGNTIDINASTLRSGKGNSCGCSRKDKPNSPSALYRRGYNILRSGARDRGLVVEITIEEYIKLADSNCFYCGKKPYDKRYQYSRKRYTRGEEHDFWLYLNGVDRIDSSVGYTVDNSVSCCTMCNRMKSDFDDEAFMEKIAEIYNHRRNK